MSGQYLFAGILFQLVIIITTIFLKSLAAIPLKGNIMKQFMMIHQNHILKLQLS